MGKRTVQFLVTLLSLLTILILGCGSDITIIYEYDAFEMVESALAYSGESLIAKAERVGMRPIQPTILDIEVEETHFSQKTGEIIYRGRMTFRCRTNVESGERIKVTPILGRRPRDLFRQWPYARMGIGLF